MVTCAWADIWAKIQKFQVFSNNITKKRDNCYHSVLVFCLELLVIVILCYLWNYCGLIRSLKSKKGSDTSAWSLIFTRSLVTLYNLFQIHFPGHLHGRDDHQVDCQGVHPQQVHLPAEPLELAGLRGHHLGLRHHRHGRGQPRGSPHLPRPPGAQDRLHHARLVEEGMEMEEFRRGRRELWEVEESHLVVGDLGRFAVSNSALGTKLRSEKVMWYFE